MPNNNKGKNVSEMLDFDVGLLGLAVIENMNDAERDSFHRNISEKQEHLGNILINEEHFEYSFLRRGEGLEVLIGKREDTMKEVMFFEDNDEITMLILCKIPDILAANLKGKFFSDLCGNIPSLPLLSQITINFVQKTEKYLNVRAKTKWGPYQAK